MTEEWCNLFSVLVPVTEHEIILGLLNSNKQLRQRSAAFIRTITNLDAVLQHPKCFKCVLHLFATYHTQSNVKILTLPSIFRLVYNTTVVGFQDPVAVGYVQIIWTRPGELARLRRIFPRCLSCPFLLRFLDMTDDKQPQLDESRFGMINDLRDITLGAVLKENDIRKYEIPWEAVESDGVERKIEFFCLSFWSWIGCTD